MHLFIKSLNESILEHFANRTLVGISLKLVKKKAKLTEYNVKLPPDTDDHKLMQILLQGAVRGDFWSNKGATLVFDDGKMALKDEIQLRINKILEPHQITRVYFTKFIIN